MFHCNAGPKWKVNRRSFLRTAFASVPLALVADQPLRADDSKLSDVGDAAVQKVRERMKGPMASITMPYNKDYSIDHGALRGWVDFMCEKRFRSSF
jgi:hypothetical protein